MTTNPTGTRSPTLRRSRLAVLALLSLAASALPAPAPAAGQDFTLEEVLSSPFPDQLVAAREAEVIAWTSNHEGSRNVWVAEGPDFQGRQITDWEGDDGRDLVGLWLTPDGRHAVVTRGHPANRNGWVATPAHEPEGGEQRTWRIPLDGGPMEELRRLSGGVLSPDGTTLAFVEDGAIRTVALEDAGADAAAGGEDPSSLVAKPRSGAGQLAWSPDGTRIAFVSSRGDHAFVGVAEADGSGYRYVDPGVDRDGNPVWSPDGTRLAFLRQPAEEAGLPFFARPDADEPWSIRVVELGADEAREVFRADPGQGSRFSGVVAESQLQWTGDGHLVFPWEKDGWRRLWAVPADGGDPRLLTPGEHEIQHVSAAPDGRTVLYDSNLDDVDRKHVWSVRVGESPELLTPGEGVEWAPVATPSGVVAFLGSGARTPARPHVLLGGERAHPQGPVPESFPDPDALVTPEAVVFPATDGLQIHGQLFLPPDLRPGERRPALMFLHGGSRRQMLLGFHNRGYYHNAYALNQYMASKGYVVLSVNYRSGVGYGLDFREAEEYGAGGASEVRDVLGAGLYLASRDDVDPDRIGLWGGSYGGYLTAQGLVHGPELFAAGVDIHGVHDWNVGIQNFVPSYEPENVPETMALALESSPITYVGRWEDPVLLIHGDDDRNVRFSETVDLVRELRALGVPHDVLVFPDEVHGFLLHESWLEAYGATEAWFDRWLDGGR